MRSILSALLLASSCCATAIWAQKPAAPPLSLHFQNAPANDAKILQIGSASIYDAYPDWMPVKVIPNFNGVEGPSYKLPGKGVPTNRWYSPLFWWKYDLDFDANPAFTFPGQAPRQGAGHPMWPLPLSNQVCPWGLMVSYHQEYPNSCIPAPVSCVWPNGKDTTNCRNQIMYGFDRDPNAHYNCFILSVDGLLVDKMSKKPFFTEPKTFGDWDLQMNWDDGAHSLSVSALAGSPMLYGEAAGGELELQLPVGDFGTGQGVRGVTFYNSKGEMIGQSIDCLPNQNPHLPDLSKATDGVVGMKFVPISSEWGNGKPSYYVLYAPQTAKWSFTQGFHDMTKGTGQGRGGYLSKLVSTNLKGKTFHFTIALLPNPGYGEDFPLQALQAFRNAAGFHVTQTAFSWDAWDQTKGSINTHYTFNVKDVSAELPSSNPSVITALFKPQQNALGASATYMLGGVSYHSPRGPLKLMQLPLNGNKPVAQFDIAYPYFGYVPALPDPELSPEDLGNLTAFVSADSRQISKGLADFFSESQPDAYSTGTMAYYKAMQMALLLQQNQGIQNIPDWRREGNKVQKEEALKDIAGFLQSDLEDFFTARRDPNLAYQWKYIAATGKDVHGFKSVQPSQAPPEVFKCMNPQANCNPNDPLTKDLQTGPYWLLDSLNKQQKTGKNPYLVLRNVDFTVNKFLKTAPGTGLNMDIAWLQYLTKNSPLASAPLYVFFAPSDKKASPDNMRQWTQCVWNQNDTTRKNGLYLQSNEAIGGGPGLPNDTARQQWQLLAVPYNGSPDYYPHRIPAGNCDILIVLDCGADCENFPATCDHGNKPVYSDEIKLVVGPVYFEGKNRRFISYDQKWTTLLGNNPWYGSTESLNDHHFGWGYLIKAAAFVAQFGKDTSWARQDKWGGLVNLLIQDVMDWRKPDNVSKQFEFVPNKYLNPMEGHMYADGSGNDATGNNEESSSEAVNFAEACIEWGTVSGQPEIRDLGILLHSIYGQAVGAYWFNVDGDVLPSTSADKPFPNAGRIWGAGNDHDTFFSGGPLDHGCESRNSDVVAIQTLPLTAGTLRLSSLKYNTRLGINSSPLAEAWKTVEAAGGAYCSGGKCYLSSLMGFQSLVQPDAALSSFKALTIKQGDFKKWYNCEPKTLGLRTPNDHSYAATFSFINSAKKLGPASQQTVPIKEGNPFCQPLSDGSVLVYNYRPVAQVYTVRGKVTPSIPPHRCVRVK